MSDAIISFVMRLTRDMVSFKMFCVGVIILACALAALIYGMASDEKQWAFAALALSALGTFQMGLSQSVFEMEKANEDD